MALKLTKADTRVFTGKAGDKVRLDASVAKAADGAPARRPFNPEGPMVVLVRA